MAKDDGMGEKTEEATPKRREEARERGQVAKSQDLTGALIMLIGFAALYILGNWFGGKLVGHFRHPLMHLGDEPLNDLAMLEYVPELAVALITLLLPFLFVLAVLAFVATAMQVGLKASPQAFEFKPEKLDPIKGIGRLFSIRSLVKLISGIVKIVLVGLVVYFLLVTSLPSVMGFIGQFDYMHNNVGPVVKFIADMICWMGIMAGGTLTIIGIIDFAYQKWQHNEDLKMSKQEVKDEMKNMEGDPQIKRKRREFARQMAQRQMVNETGSADVVVTNPTHFSVALKYRDGDPAPRVVAKGTDRLALKIREVASENKVPIVEKPELARALYRWVDINELVPDTYWDAVAEVLAYVYSMDEEKRKRALGESAN